ncbi:MAG: peptide deformylase [Saprospiraceae bacterium]|nr:peptide deformylase [Saprospiraceae bacterium]
MAVRDILRLGNPKLLEVCAPVREDEVEKLEPVFTDMHDTLMDFRERYDAGRAIAAPQIGVMKRIIYLHIKEPKIFLNPTLFKKSDETITLWDDCMCFPDLLVRVERHRECSISYRDPEWNKRTERLEGDLSELLQHECDHLFGILAVSRAIDGRSFALRSEAIHLNAPLANQHSQ